MMTTIQRIFIAGVAALTLLFTGCAGDYYVGGPGPGVGGFVPFWAGSWGGGHYWGGHHFYGRSFGSRHFALAHGGFHGGGHAGFHGGGGHGGGHR